MSTELKAAMEHAWCTHGIAHINRRSGWRIAALGGLVPCPGRTVGLIRTSRRYLPLYRQPRLGLPKRPRRKRRAA